MKKFRIFPDLVSVSRGQRRLLQHRGLLNKDDTVVSYSRINPKVRDRKLSEDEAKQLILLELSAAEPRVDLINRLVCYMTKIDKEQILGKVNKALDTKGGRDE